MDAVLSIFFNFCRALYPTVEPTALPSSVVTGFLSLHVRYHLRSGAGGKRNKNSGLSGDDVLNKRGAGVCFVPENDGRMLASAVVGQLQGDLGCIN
jgi:hypothetical protein